MADTEKENVAKGVESVVELSTVEVLVLIDWDIFSTFSNGVVPTARRGNNSEKAVYLQNIDFD